MTNRNRYLFILVIVFSISWLFQTILIPLIIAFLIAVLSSPIVDFLVNKTKLNREISAFVTVIGIGVLVALLFFVIGNNIYSVFEKSDLYVTKISDIAYKSIDYINSKFGFKLVHKSILKSETLEKKIRDNIDTIFNLLTNSTSVISNLLLMPLYVFFMLLYKNFFIEFLFKWFSAKSDAFMTSVMQGVYDVIHNYLKGVLLVMLIVGVLNSIGLLILGLENAIFWGFLAAILLLIPYIGISIGALTPTLIALVTNDSPWYAVAVFSVFIGVQIIEGNFITPKIVGSKVSINSFVAILSFLFFGFIFGLSGLVLALPITAVLKVIFDHIPELHPLGYVMGNPPNSIFETEKTKKEILTDQSNTNAPQ